MMIRNILNGEFDNHILPFLWIHGETEDVYRDNVRAIYNANIRAFCIEARPHKNFCQKQWWDDLGILLDEAEKLGMKVWILDDKHFPTGYANGGVENAPTELHRQNIFCKEYPVRSGHMRMNLKRECHPSFSLTHKAADLINRNVGSRNHFNDDTLISVSALRLDRKASAPISLAEYVHDGILDWEAPAGRWKIQICFLSRNSGVHRSYINMMDKDSCRILIDQVYEPHYRHFKDKFGTVIAGFFSDEPELGNGLMYKMYNLLGTDQDLPWSRELSKALRERLGKEYRTKLSLLWNNEGDEDETARVRYTYMDCVTRLVKKDFSEQIGQWCRSHGVEYIGHLVEDNNQHARTGTSLGHYFRGLKGQTMAGIDIIGNSLYPQKENMTGNAFIWRNQPVDGEFYHFALAKLGSSLGQINPGMNSRTMCELFGNYGWMEGVRLEKFLLDHCLVRGVNYFVPHAFDCKNYPDRDCPPHFYAHGNDPLYRHFGQLMAYTNRVASLLDGSVSETPAAILYHAEAEWCSVYGKKRSNPQYATAKDALREGYMLMQKPARILAEHQIDFHFIPADAFSEREFYHTEIGRDLTVNSKHHTLFIIPYAKYIPREVADAIAEIRSSGGRAVFLEGLPQGICQGGQMNKSVMECPVIPLDGLLDYVKGLLPDQPGLIPECPRMRMMCVHWDSGMEGIFLVNEDDRPYSGTLSVPWKDGCYVYDPWENCTADCKGTAGKIALRLRPSESVFIIHDVIYKTDDTKEPLTENSLTRQRLTEFCVSRCRSIDYPAFEKDTRLHGTGDYSLIDPGFCGFIRYDTVVTLQTWTRVTLTITDACEGVEVFVNGKSAGIQIIPEFRYDITALCRKGKNRIRIEVATTLERENTSPRKLKKAGATGITGEVYCTVEG